MRAYGIRRRELLGAVVGMATLAPALRAAETALLPTPRQTAGPFYPDALPLDSDNDLVQVAGRDALAAGQTANVYGRVLDPGGRPIANARVEIWQCDANGRYHHPGDRGSAPRDDNFQGFGATVTDADGRYRFRTIKPVPYPGRTPHIHFRLEGAGFESLTTQMYVRGEPRNETDFLLNRIRDARARESLLVEFAAEPGASAALSARFDLVLAHAAAFERAT